MNAPIELHSPIGLIAGSGIFPLRFAESARRKGIEIVAVAHRGETDERLEQLVQSCTWVRVGQLGKLLRTFIKSGVQEVAFAGGISRIKLFGGVRPDLKALSLIARLGSMKDDAILRGVAEEIERSGMRVFGANLLIPEYSPETGCLTTRDLNQQECRDALIGWHAARALGALDIGQTVVACDGLVLAVEALEGTDQCIRRAGALCGADPGAPRCVVVKVCKPGQDRRIDLPTVGEHTIVSMSQSRASALVLEAHRSVVLEPQAVVRLADKNGIAIRVVGACEELELECS